MTKAEIDFEFQVNLCICEASIKVKHKFGDYNTLCRFINHSLIQSASDYSINIISEISKNIAYVFGLSLDDAILYVTKFFLNKKYETFDKIVKNIQAYYKGYVFKKDNDI